jgi:glycerate dehydrogenase
MGVVGLGRIGSAVARRAGAFDMKLLAYTPHPKAIEGLNIEFCSLDRLFREADIVSLHCPSNEVTKDFVTAARLATMKHTALLINTARGDLVDEEALADALVNNRLRGVAVDVLRNENRLLNGKILSPLQRVPNCLIMPHTAWASSDARQRLLDITASNLKAFIEGRPKNVISRDTPHPTPCYEFGHPLTRSVTSKDSTGHLQAG